MTTSRMPDPLDLPIFADPTAGRVRSDFTLDGTPNGDGSGSGTAVPHPNGHHVSLKPQDLAPADLHPSQREVSYAVGVAPAPNTDGSPPLPPFAVTASALREAAVFRRSAVGPSASAALVDWAVVARLRSEVGRRLADEMGEARWDQEAQEEAGWRLIGRVLEEDAAVAVARRGQARSIADQELLAKAVFDSCFGLGRLQALVDDERVENIMITGCDRVVVEYADGTVWRADPVADSDEELCEFLAFLAARADNPRSFTPGQPTLHLTLPGGARLAAARDTARVSVVIRRHRVRQVTLDDLTAWGSLTSTLAAFLRAAVKARLSIVVSGEQGVGKTTLLRALCAEIDRFEPVGTFESEYELFLHEMTEQHETVHAWEAREGSGERVQDGRSAGSRTIAEQIIDSFRFNLGRQILGEIRGPEVWSMVKLMESGSGSISTTHAGSAQQTMRKLITCAMEAGPQISQELAATKLADTVDLVVHLACHTVAGPDGSVGRKHRFVEEVLEITPGERPRGYASSIIFAARPGRCATAHTRPDGLIGRLCRSGFDPAGFDAELAAGGL